MKLFFYSKEKNHTRSDTDALINKSLSGYLGREVSAVIQRTSAGKPYSEEYPLHIGVTHTDDTVLVAINERPFGIDCESKDRTAINMHRIAEKYFCENERTYVFENCSDKQTMNERFLEIWVKKEAYVKFTGEGLSGMSKCDVTSLGVYKLIENQNNLLIYIYEEDKHE